MHIHGQTPPIVHCDVKPDNFLIRAESGSGKVAHLFLIDFGIAHSLQPGNEKGTARGTPSFMAPEQFKGNIVCQSDQYALALIACFLLTGQYPLQPDRDIWRWDNWETAHTYFAPSPPSKLNPQRIRSEEIDAIILKALAKEPEQRFATIWEFACNLATAIERSTANRLSESLVRMLTPASTTIPEYQPVPLQAIYQTEEILVDET
jgi:serine/threonine-protein kinase